MEQVISGNETIDYITFSGSGEPTLNSAIGKIIRRIKSMSKVPVAVLTNGTLLYMPEVRNDLMLADLVVPSLDAISANVFDMLNRPHRKLDADKIVEGIKSFKNQFAGEVWAGGYDCKGG